jgi:hypothetical protein
MVAFGEKGSGILGVFAHGFGAFLGDDNNVLTLDHRAGCTTVNILKYLSCVLQMGELYTLNGSNKTVSKA